MTRLLWLVLLLALQAGCVSSTIKSTSVPALDRSAEPIPEDQLLDVGIAVLNPGIDDIDEDEIVYPEVRRAEASFMANELAGVLAEQGAWGAVRVVPDGRQFTDVMLEGRILHSDGERLELAVTARDARGVVWINKTYSAVTSRYAYEPGTRLSGDPFLALYRQVANELLAVFAYLPGQDRLNIRRIAELQFAREFSEDAFADYLSEDDKGIVTLRRLPAEDDPMLERVRTIRQRNYVFVDTLQGYYTGFSEDMHTPYQEWRKLSYDEIVALRELRRQATVEMIAGGAAIIAGIAARGSSNEYARTAGTVGVFGGGYLLKGGLEKRAESKLHELAIEELSQSLEAEITPRVIELEDRTVRLSGNVQDQYDQWRELLADIYAAEIGALDGDIAIEVEDSPQTTDDASL